jgi:hypothetical protein
MALCVRPGCGIEFVPKRPDSIYHSESCCKAAARDKRGSARSSADNAGPAGDGEILETAPLFTGEPLSARQVFAGLLPSEPAGTPCPEVPPEHKDHQIHPHAHVRMGEGLGGSRMNMCSGRWHCETCQGRYRAGEPGPDPWFSGPACDGGPGVTVLRNRLRL